MSDTSRYATTVLKRFGSFRELTLLGFASATDGATILGIGSPGCETTLWGRTYEIGCPTTS